MIHNFADFRTKNDQWRMFKETKETNFKENMGFNSGFTEKTSSYSSPETTLNGPKKTVFELLRLFSNKL